VKKPKGKKPYRPTFAKNDGKALGPAEPGSRPLHRKKAKKHRGK